MDDAFVCDFCFFSAELSFSRSRNIRLIFFSFSLLCIQAPTRAVCKCWTAWMARSLRVSVLPATLSLATCLALISPVRVLLGNRSAAMCVDAWLFAVFSSSLSHLGSRVCLPLSFSRFRVFSASHSLVSARLPWLFAYLRRCSVLSLTFSPFSTYQLMDLHAISPCLCLIAVSLLPSFPQPNAIFCAAITY